MSDPVLSLFTCKICKTRLFEKDCAAHLARHGLKIAPDKVLTHFERGPATQPARPGTGATSMYQKRGKRPRGSVVGEEDQIEPDFDDLN